MALTVHALDKLARDHGRKDLARRLNAQQIRHDRAAGQGERKWAA